MLHFKRIYLKDFILKILFSLKRSQRFNKDPNIYFACVKTCIQRVFRALDYFNIE